MKIELSNHQKQHRVQLAELKALTRWLMRRVHRLDPGPRCRELSLVLTDDEGITALNAAHLGKPCPTDVLSFRYDPLPGEPDGWSGEVVVNVQRAFELGPAEQGVAHELALYIAHGCHHLSGANDDTPARRRRMLRRESAWLTAATDEGLLRNLVSEPSGASR